MKKHHTKQMAFVAVLLATLTLIGGCGNQEPSDTATESAPDTEVTTTRAASAAETPVVLTETQKIEKILTASKMQEKSPDCLCLNHALSFLSFHYRINYHVVSTKIQFVLQKEQHTY